MNWTTACGHHPHHLRFRCSRNAPLWDRPHALCSSRIDRELHDILHDADRDNLLSNSKLQFQPASSVKIVTRIRTHRLIRLSLRPANESVFLIVTNFTGPVTSIFTNFNEPVAR